MAVVSDTSFLTQPIKELPFSENFLSRCKVMGFDTLQEIIDTDQKDLIQDINFNYIWYNELLDFLNDRDMLYLMDDSKRF